MNINNYLDQLQTESVLQEVDIKSLMNTPIEKVKKSINDIKTFIASNDVNKLKALAKSAPKVEFDKIEKFAKEKISNFNNLYSLAKKILINSLNVNENQKGIKELAALIAIISSIAKDPKSKLKELLKKIMKLSKNVIISDIAKFILSAGALLLASVSVYGSLALNPMPVTIIYFIIVHLIYKYV